MRIKEDGKPVIGMRGRNWMRTPACLPSKGEEIELVDHHSKKLRVLEVEDVVWSMEHDSTMGWSMEPIIHVKTVNTLDMA